MYKDIISVNTEVDQYKVHYTCIYGNCNVQGYQYLYKVFDRYYRRIRTWVCVL